MTYEEAKNIREQFMLYLEGIISDPPTPELVQEAGQVLNNWNKNHMSYKQAANVLKHHQRWRTGGSVISIPNPASLTKALKIAISELEKLSDEHTAD